MKIRRVHLLPAACALVAIGAGPCGGSQSADTGNFKGTQKDVAQAVFDFRDAVAKRDQSKICDTYFTADLKAKVAADGKAAKRGDSCSKVIEDSIADIDATDIKVKDVKLSPDNKTATVTVTTNLSKGPDATDTLTMKDENGWRISALP